MKNYKFPGMKRIILTLAVSVMVVITASSQGNSNREKLNTYKIGFFTKKLNLTASEAQKFWPVYNEYQGEKIKLQTERLGLIRTFNQGESAMSDEQILRLGDRLVESQVKETEMAVKFHEMLKQVLPPAKVIRFYQAENQFRVFLLKELQNRQQQNRPLRDNDPADLPDL